MPTITYAQNFEDVMLHRALRDVSGGTYIDVGAHDPTEYSVTKHFYDLGWRGINVEPVRAYFDALARERPEDINLEVAAGATSGEMELLVVANTGLSTFVARHAQDALERGYASVPTVVKVETLDRICARLASREVHFLKIDVEGAEADVLRGMSFDTCRPWIVVVEATRPGTTDLAHDEWEPRLLDRGYVFVYFDGLNRFYIACEHDERRAAFGTPPNVFDEFVPARQHALERDVAQLRPLAAQLDEVDQWIRAMPPLGAESADDDRIAQLKARFTRLVDLLDRSLADRATSEAARVTSEAARVMSEAARVTSEAARAAFQIEVTRLASELATATGMIDGSRERHDRLESEAAGLRKLVDSHDATLRRALEDLQSAHRRIDHDLQTSTERIVGLERQCQALNAELLRFHRSRSWRVTAPMRALMRWIRQRP